MAEKIKLRISSAVAAFVAPGLSSDEKLHGLKNAGKMLPVDRVTLLFCLMRDADTIVKGAASTAFAVLPEESLLAFIAAPGAHPAILDAITRVHFICPDVSAALLECPTLSTQAAEFLKVNALVHAAGAFDEIDLDGDDKCDVPSSAQSASQEKLPLDGDATGATGPVAEDEEFLSKYQMAQKMTVSEKIKMALTGDKEWRAILINDSNKLVSAGVIKNARITEGEVLQVLKVGAQNDEIIRLICANKEWVKNYLIRKALVECPKTPLPNALRFLASLGEKDIAGYAKSKNISSVISTQAKRMILAKKR